VVVAMDLPSESKWMRRWRRRCRGGGWPGKEPIDQSPITDQRMILHGTNQQDDQEEEDKYTSLRRMRKQ